MSQTINVNLPGQEVVDRAKEDLQEALTKKTGDETLEREVAKFLASAGGDIHYALAKLRMQLERELRRILGKRSSTVVSPGGEATEFLSTRSLFNQFVQALPAYERFRGSLDYVLKVCNAAIHAQVVPEGHAQEALHMGLQMLSEFRSIDPE